jgi:nucleolar GTP-binding protein
MHLALPIKRDDIPREAEIRPSEKTPEPTNPETPQVLTEKSHVLPQKTFVATERMKEWIHQQDLYYNFDPEYKGIDWRERYELENPDWRFDPIPEIVDGRNVMDFWSPDLEEKMMSLEKEEVARLRRELIEQEQTEDLREVTPEQMEKVVRIREKRSLMMQRHRIRRGANDSRLPFKHGADTDKTLTSFEKHLSDLGLDGSEVVDRIKDRSRSRSGARSPRDSSTSRSRSQSRSGRKRTRAELDSRGISASRASVTSRAFKNPEEKSKADRLAKRARRELSRSSKRGESDRHVYDLKPKHLFSGKRKLGKTDRR